MIDVCRSIFQYFEEVKATLCKHQTKLTHLEAKIDLLLGRDRTTDMQTDVLTFDVMFPIISMEQFDQIELYLVDAQKKRLMVCSLLLYRFINCASCFI